MRRLTLEFVKNEFEKEGYKLLCNLYINSNKQNLQYICSNGHKHSITWSDWHHHNVRCPSCANLQHSIRISGTNHPNWKGGVSCEPYCDAWADKDYKESIKERDGYGCLNPACVGNSNRLSIHHIDYDKKNCEPINLITLCISCNSKANFNRDWHKSWYKAIMNNRSKLRRDRYERYN